MKRLHAYTYLPCLAFVIGCFVALMLVWAGAVALASQPASVSQVGAAIPPGGVLASQYVPGISCTLSITTDQDFTLQDASTTFADVAAFPALSTYYDELALSFGDVPPGNSLQFAAFDEYFRLDNTVVGASYKVDAIPDYTNNYNLGLIIYDVGFRPIMTDTNAVDNYVASLTLLSSSPGPYYFKIVQLTPYCTGRTYTLRVTYTGPTATPTSTPTTTPTPTATPKPWALPDQYDSSVYAPNYNDTLAHAVALGASTTSGLTLYNATLYPSDPGNDQDWYIIYGSAGYQYTVGAAPDSGFVYPYMLMQVFGPDQVSLVGQVIGSNNPSINWTANGPGSYYIHIARASGSPTNGTYHVTWATNSPTATPTATPSVPPPVSAFTASPRSGYPPLIVKFTDQSSGLITGRLWRFGDGAMSTSQNPTYAYSASGVYTVALTVSGPGGSDTLTQAHYIRAYLPQPIFSEPVCGTTNNTFPIISGLAPYGFTVNVYEDETPLLTTATTFSNTFSFLAPLVSGWHILTATATNIAGTSASSSLFVLTVSPALAYDPVGVTVSYAAPWGMVTGHPHDLFGCANPGDWRIWLPPGYTTTIAVPVRYTIPAVVTITLGDQTQVVADPVGSLRVPLTAVFAPPIHSGVFAITVTAGGQTVATGGSVLIDPDGYVYDKRMWDSQSITQTLAGITVTCQYSNTIADQWTTWEAWAYSQVNPLVTGEDGRYSFFVPRGTYRVTANHPDYWPYTSPDLVVWDKPAHVNIPLILTRRLYLPIILRQ